VVITDDGAGPRDGLEDLFSHAQVAYRRNEKRLGLIANWRRVFELSRSLHPDGTYFAWGSDHDLWEPEWAETLVRALEGSPSSVLAYPWTSRIDAGKTPTSRAVRSAGVDIDEPVKRLRRSYDLLAAGDMIYGMFRVGALERCGVFPRVIAPDRLLLAELSLQGPFVQVPEVLWHRRRDVRFSLGRQRASLFGEDPPWHARLPWWVQHLGAFTRDAGLRDQATLGRTRAVRAVAVHAVLVLRRALRRFVARRWTRIRLRAGARMGTWARHLRSRDR
jgi:hypothetical protein